MVAESKAYCPDCGAPMDEEQKRSDSYELDSQRKTENLSPSNQFRLFEQLNLSSFFNFKPPNSNEFKTVENEVTQVQLNSTENQPKLVQFNPFDDLTNTNHIIPPAAAKINTIPPTNIAVEPQNKSDLPITNNATIGNAPNSRKTFYIVGGIIIVFLFFIIAIVTVILSIVYLNFWK